MPPTGFCGASKNRFGSTNEIGVFEMQAGMAWCEVEKSVGVSCLSGQPGRVPAVRWPPALWREAGPSWWKMQALVTPEQTFGIAQAYQAAGTDFNRVNLLIAVLEKRCRYEMSRYDAYVNIAGGMRMNEPALDLAIIMALVSSMKDKPVNPKCMIFGEVGLAGEVRAVSQAEQRVHEAIKLGFESCILPQVSLDKMKNTDKITLYGVSNVREAIRLI